MIELKNLCKTYTTSDREITALEDINLTIRDGEIFARGLHISPYEQGNIFNRDPMRPKRLLMHKSEIRRLDQQVATKGLTLIPLDIYLKDNRVKMNLGLCKGKHNYDKRDDIAKRDADREITRSLRRSAKEG